MPRVKRALDIQAELDDWINHFRVEMLGKQHQSIGYNTMMNLLGRFGCWILSNPEKLTEEQKKIILDIVEESNQYNPPYARIKWQDKYLQYMIPDILKKNIKEPWKMG